MSQLQVTGEAKIRDIQGPVVANSGVITALDGAASQYVRGDGTLADFPTSTGGGSSVSYYLNSSVSQGTIGGVAYRELSKEPIIGAGTDITISANGYVANYITDANDPDVLSVPGGNFNCEFYFSVNNNTGNPTTYAELYKYDGATFTLLGTSAGVPESINQGTTIAPYYFAIPVATAALALTDRLAIRIYVSVDGRTVTLHTENSHLCQVVTTFSKGMVSLNNLTDQSQFITTGTSGTNFNIVSSGDTHTFNLPVASATNTGKLSNTDWSTFNNKLSTATAAATYVPYTGATTNVDLGFFNFDANQINGFKIIAKLDGTNSGSLILRTGTSGYSYGNDSISLISSPTIANTLTIVSDVSLVTKIAQIGLGSLTATRTYTLPDASGTIALTSQLTGGTVTSVGLSSATSGVTIGSSPITTSGTITLAIATASGSQNGLLSSTDWTTFNGKQAALTNPITGTGTRTINYLPIFSGSDTTIANSAITDNGTTVTLISRALSGTSATFSSTTTATAFIPTGSTIPTNGMYLSAANTLNFATNSLNRFTIASDGVATFSTDLYVGRNIYVTDIEAGVGANYFSPYSGGSTPLSFNYNSAGSVVWNNGGTKMTLTSAGALQLVSSISATSATLNGNVIINSTATALSPLQVVATGTIVRLGEQSGTTGKQFLIGIDATSGRTELQSVWQGTSFTSLALQPSGGNVLIGTTGDNGAKLQVSGAATFSSSVTAGAITSSVATGNGSFYINNASLTNKNWTLIPSTSGTETDLLFFYTGASAGTRMTLTNAGNVGIGTSSPTSKLAMVIASSGTNVSGLDITNNVDASFNVSLRTGITEITAGGSGNMVFSNSAERMRITSGGAVGIGISSPTRRLHVYGSTSIFEGILVENSLSNAYALYQSKTGNSDLWQFGTWNNNSFRIGTSGVADFLTITSVGSVLLGTTTSQSDVRLQVAASGGAGSWISGTFAGTGNTDKVVIGNYTGVGPAIGGHNNALTAWSSLTFNFGGGAVYAGTLRIDNNSDQRFKRNITSVENALDIILKLQGRKFNMIDEDNILRYGFIAQEVQPYLSDFVTESTREHKDENIHIKNLLTLETSGAAWAALLVEAIKEQQAKIEAQDAKIEELKALIAAK